MNFSLWISIGMQYITIINQQLFKIFTKVLQIFFTLADVSSGYKGKLKISLDIFSEILNLL